MKIALLLGFLALAGCASEWKCPNAPKVVAKFSVGTEVAVARTDGSHIMDVGIITGICYGLNGDRVYYTIKFTNPDYGPAIVSEEDDLIEVVAYPDGALKP
jgi:hypothetical protein